MRNLTKMELNGLRFMDEHGHINIPSICGEAVYRTFENLETVGFATSEKKHHTIPNHKSRFFITDLGRQYLANLNATAKGGEQW